MGSPGFGFRVIQLRHVPYLYGLIAASRNQVPAVGAERQAADKAGVTAEVALQLSAVAVPDFHGTVFTCCGDPPAIVVGTERHRVDLPAMLSPERQNIVACLDVPNDDGVLLTRRR